MPSDRPTKSHGTFTLASTVGRLLTAAGYGAAFVRKGVGYGGHKCMWDRQQQGVHIYYRCHDDTPDSDMEAQRAEMFDLYTDLLTEKGYEVERGERSLWVTKKEN